MTKLISIAKRDSPMTRSRIVTRTSWRFNDKRLSALSFINLLSHTHTLAHAHPGPHNHQVREHVQIDKYRKIPRYIRYITRKRIEEGKIEVKRRAVLFLLLVLAKKMSQAGQEQIQLSTDDTQSKFNSFAWDYWTVSC